MSTGVDARAGRMCHRCQNKNPRERLTSGCEWRHAPEARAEDFEKVSWVEFLARKKTIDFHLHAEARPVALWRVRTWLGGGGADEKVIIERLCISLPYVETFKLKGNKRFRTWTKKSLRVFRVSGFLCSMYICYEHSMYVSHICIWLCYIISLKWGKLHSLDSSWSGDFY